MTTFRRNAITCPNVQPSVVKSTCSKNIRTSLDPYSIIEDITRNLSIGLEEAALKASAMGGLLEGWDMFNLEVAGLLDLAIAQLLLLKSGFWSNTTENPVDRVCKCESSCCSAGTVNKEFNFTLDYSKLIEAMINTPELSMLGPSLSVLLGGAFGFNGCCMEDHEVLTAQFNLYQTFVLIIYLWFLIIVSVFVMDFNCNENTGLWAFLGCSSKSDCCDPGCDLKNGMTLLLEAIHNLIVSMFNGSGPKPNPTVKVIPDSTQEAADSMISAANTLLDFINSRLATCGAAGILGPALSTQVSVLEAMIATYLEIVNALPPPGPAT